MSESIQWLHPKDDADQWDGFNDSGIETFSGSPITHLAREIIQNSLDAKMDGPVEVDFTLTSFPVAGIPDIDAFINTFLACSESAVEEGRNAQVFFNRANKLLNQDRISVLEISDFNTRGVEGPCENGKPFYALLKARGQSKKPSETAGGSFGIGKFAPYAVSSLRTVFVSTVYRDNDDTLKQLSQGKSILMSHEVDGQRRQGTGFLGYPERCRPLEGNPDISSALLRSDGLELDASMLGTKILVMGFKQPKNWQQLLALSVAINFFAALERGQLVVNIGDEIRVDKDTVDDYLDPEAFKSIIWGTDISRSDIAYAASYLRALRSDNSIVNDTENRALGHVKFQLVVEDELPRRIAILRNGMFITDRLDGLKRFGGFKEFAGVIECQSDEGNAILRGMEPPRHDKFEPERLPTEKERTKARKALDELADWAREMLQRHAKDEVSDITEVEELAEYFADDTESRSGDEGDEVDPLGDVVFSPKPIKRARAKPSSGRTQEGTSMEEGDDPGGGGDDGSGGGDGQGGVGQAEGGSSNRNKTGSQIGVSHVRMIGASTADISIAFTPDESCRARLIISAAGADTDIPITVSGTSAGEIKKGQVEFEAVANKRARFKLELADRIVGALKVDVYEV